MIIDGTTIVRAIDAGTWKAWRGDKLLTSKDLSIGVSSVDLTLGNKLLVPVIKHENWIDLVRDTELEWTELQSSLGKFYLGPGDFALATVQERFDTTSPITVMGNDLYTVHAAPKLDGRSTVARLGLATHITASDGHYGFTGNFTLELVNLGPLNLVLTVGMRIAQLSFHAVTNGVEAYKGAYATAHNGGPFPPKLGKARF